MGASARVATVFGLLGLGLLGCDNPPVYELVAPLTIVDTFPSNGATLPGANVTQIDLIFSQAVDGKKVLKAIKLEMIDQAGEVEAPYALSASELGKNGFDDELLTFSAVIGEPSSDGSLPDNKTFRLTVGKGLTAKNGSVLPADVLRRFATD